jgi:phosphate:Na+ symporter
MDPQVITLLGSSALLVYSIEELSKDVQYIAGSKFQIWINTLAKNRLGGMVLGMLISLLLSSSGAVTMMLVGMANARLLSLSQVLSVALGAALGTTFIVQLFAFDITDYGLLIVTVGVLGHIFLKANRLSTASRAILFLGLMLYSMKLLMDATTALQANEFFHYVITYFKDRPAISLLLAIILTAINHSSAATIGFVMSLMVARHGTIYEAIPWVLGANLGTTVNAFFASFGAGALGKQAALGNLLVKVFGVMVAYPLMQYLGKVAVFLTADLSRQIANVHTLFNFALAVLFFPFIPLGVRIVRMMIPEVKDDGPFTFHYLDPKSLASPEMALAQSQREILRLSDTVEQMVEKSIYLFTFRNIREIEALKSMDQVVDFLNRGIKMYLTKLSQEKMTPEQVQREFELLLRTNDLENIGDIVDKNITELVRKNIKKGYVFSREGWNEIMSFHSKVVECLRVSTAYFNSRDRALAAKLFVLYQEIEDMMLDLSEQHVQRLHRGVRESMETTSVHLDLLGYLLRIANLSVHFSKVRYLTGTTVETIPTGTTDL